MSALMPVIVVLLALVAAGWIAWLAWELTSKDTHDLLERTLGRGRLSGGDDLPPPPGEPEAGGANGTRKHPDEPPAP